MRRTALLVVACVAVTALGSGCATGTASPNDTLSAYAKAVREGRVEEAYALLSVETRRSVTLEQFRKLVLESKADMEEIAKALSRPSSDPVVSAVVTTTTGDEVVLFYEHGKWRVDGASVDLYGQSTPKQAVRAFLRAYERRRWDILLRLVPDAKKTPDPKLPPLDEAKLKAAWEGPEKEDMDRIAQALRAALADATIEETGDRAAMPYGTGAALLLVREHGLWKIEDFE